MPLPRKSEPKIFQILVRTHKTTLFFTVPPSTSIGFLKEQTLSALTSGLNEEEGIPPVTKVEDFELCRRRVVKGKDRNAATQREYDLLEEPESTIKQIKLVNWEVLYIQFKNVEGQPLEIIATDPPIDDEEDGETQHTVQSSLPLDKGKRKATDDNDEDSP
ncbi:hypothetical protein J3R30DRAFT_3702083 [Lentinula aciculospora]|uniref:Uncharacterized protein n=1 Tax=Lentinula aciculospora TaxID=153920 RepID=A0A9W9ABJ7_9AGAR|nr:hypothetical protein J3R30DRAFT_3702083 [Lentinula aciculospora]